MNLITEKVKPESAGISHYDRIYDVKTTKNLEFEGYIVSVKTFINDLVKYKKISEV